MKILAFAATNSRTSINQQLVSYATRLVDPAAHDVELIDLNDYEMPLYSTDREAELGQPEPARAFIDKIANSDAVVISFAEHNGTYTVAYKNIFDWASRVNKQVFQGKPMVMLATSPGPGGAASVLKSAVESSVYFDGKVVGKLSVPSFYDNFDAATAEMSNETLRTELGGLMRQLTVPDDSMADAADGHYAATA